MEFDLKMKEKDCVRIREKAGKAMDRKAEREAGKGPGRGPEKGPGKEVEKGPGKEAGKGAGRVLLLTPPMVQLNTPYPAVPVLAGFLKSRGVAVRQADLSLEVALRLFTPQVVREAAEALKRRRRLPEAARAFREQAAEYEANVAPAVAFLQGRAPELAWRFSRPGSLPAGPHFRELDPDGTGDPEAGLDAIYGPQAIADRAKLRASLFLDDLAAALATALDPDFALARYAERLAVAAPSFSPLLRRLRGAPSRVDRILEEILEPILRETQPDFVGVTAPFPGTVYGAFRCAEIVRRLAPGAKTMLGGGYVNSELRDLSDPRVFDSFDFVLYDEGFDPLLGVLGLGPRVRTKTRADVVAARRGRAARRPAAPPPPRAVPAAERPQTCAAHAEVVVSDYSDTDFSRYLQMCESANPMHRLWSDGRWLKVQLAAGCYWHRCRFCDVALDYIGNYRAPRAAQAADALLRLRDETGIGAFHFTDEAVPPALCRSLSEELLRRGERLVWWGNVRFDPGFDPATAELMARAGCVGASAGLECANDRLLAEMRKGITLERARAACEAFADAGILVHAYLMYGYPSQTRAETLGALDFLRRLFADGLVQSAFWHRFALTVHSPLAAEPPPGLRPIVPPVPRGGRFALNEIPYEATGPARAATDLGPGLSLATYNYMLGRGLDLPVSFWFRRRR